jgi:hypothetical protein
MNVEQNKEEDLFAAAVEQRLAALEAAPTHAPTAPLGDQSEDVEQNKEEDLLAAAVSCSLRTGKLASKYAASHKQSRQTTMSYVLVGHDGQMIERLPLDKVRAEAERMTATAASIPSIGVTTAANPTQGSLASESSSKQGCRSLLVGCLSLVGGLTLLILGLGFCSIISNNTSTGSRDSPQSPTTKTPADSLTPSTEPSSPAIGGLANTPSVPGRTRENACMSTTPECKKWTELAIKCEENMKLREQGYMGELTSYCGEMEDYREQITGIALSSDPGAYDF